MLKSKGLTVIGSVILALIILVSAFYFILPKSSIKVTQKKEQTANKISPTQPSTLGTLKNLLSGGKTETCIIAYPNNQEKGTVYVADKKFAGNFIINQTAGKTVTGNVVSDGNYVYIWSSKALAGIKIKLDALTNQSTASAQTGNLNFNQQININCSNWVVDNSKFAIPSGIIFTDMTNFLLKPSIGPTGAPQTKAATACNQIADPGAKAACIKALQQAGY